MVTLSVDFLITDSITATMKDKFAEEFSPCLQNVENEAIQPQYKACFKISSAYL